MSEDLLVEEARRRREVFKNLALYLKRIKAEMKKIDGRSKVFLFGSALRGDHTTMSDVDILILTGLKPAEVISRLREAGFDEPFEFHVVDERRFSLYRRFVKEIEEV